MPWYTWAIIVVVASVTAFRIGFIYGCWRMANGKED
jgi:hypothetical protein